MKRDCGGGRDYYDDLAAFAADWMQIGSIPAVAAEVDDVQGRRRGRKWTV